MDPALFDALNEEVDRVFNNWTVSELVIALHPGLDSPPTPVNIAPNVKPSVRVTKKAMVGALFLPPDLPSPDDNPPPRLDQRKPAVNAQLTAIIANACQLAGFRSTLLGSSPNQQFPSITYGHWSASDGALQRK